MLSARLNHKQKPKPSVSWQFEALGTKWEIVTPSAIAAEEKQSITQVLARIDQTWSRFRDDSVVATMAKSAGTYSFSEPDIELLRWYQQLYIATDGSVTPLIGQTLADAGYDSTYTLIPKQKISETPNWDERLKLTSEGLQVLTPCLLDVGAAGKGFAVDQVSSQLKGSYVIDAGGDIKVSGQLQTIGLEDPRSPDYVIGTIPMLKGSICGSAGNRRTWNGGKWHHIINPFTSLPTADITATWVIAETAMVADGLATALFFTPPEKLLQLTQFDYVILHSDNSVSHSASSQVKLFTE